MKSGISTISSWRLPRVGKSISSGHLVGVLIPVCGALAACSGGAAGSAETDPLAGLTLISEDPSDLPLSGLPDEWQGLFNSGDVAFEQVFGGQ